MIPNLCRLPVVLACMVVVELLLIVYVLSLAPLVDFDWSRFALSSLYVQWIALCGLFAACQLRTTLNSLPLPLATVLCLSLMAGTTLLVNGLFQSLGVLGQVQQDSYNAGWALRDTIIVCVLTAIALRYGFLQQRWMLEQQATQAARYEALQSRIQPHFLFNTMNSIASLVQVAPERAEAAIEDLCGLLRQQLAVEQRFHRWVDELALCEAYLRIESLRLGERLRVEWDVAAVPDDLQLPPLLVQPLIENAIRHGIAKLTEGGYVKISAERRAGRSRRAPAEIRLVIENSLPTDFLPYAASEAEAPEASGFSREHGIALANVRARVASLYRHAETSEELASADFELLSGLCRVTLRLPYMSPNLPSS